MKKGLSLKKIFFLCIIFFAKNNLLLCSHSSSEESEGKSSDSSEASLSSTISLDQSRYAQNDSPEEKVSDNQTKRNKEGHEALRCTSHHIPIKRPAKKLRSSSHSKTSSPNISRPQLFQLDELLYTFENSKATLPIKTPQSFKQITSIYDYLSEEDFEINNSMNLPNPSNPIAIPGIKSCPIDPLTNSSEEISSPTQRITYPPFAPEKKSPAKFIASLDNEESEDGSENSTEKSSSPDTNPSITELFAKEGAKFLIIPILQIYHFMDELKKLGELEYQSKNVNALKTQKYKEQKDTLIASLQSTIIHKLYFQQNILGNKNEYYSLDSLNQHSLTPDRLYENNKEFFFTCHEKSLIKSFVNNGLSLDNQMNLFEQNCQSKYLNPVVAHALITYGKVFEILEQFKNKKDGKKPNCLNRVALLQKIKADIEIFDSSILPKQEENIIKILTRQKLFNLIDSYNSKMSDLSGASSDKTLKTRYIEMIFVPSNKTINTATERYLAQNVQ
jgi:hypothetical protein